MGQKTQLEGPSPGPLDSGTSVEDLAYTVATALAHFPREHFINCLFVAVIVAAVARLLVTARRRSETDPGPGHAGRGLECGATDNCYAIR